MSGARERHSSAFVAEVDQSARRYFDVVIIEHRRRLDEQFDEFRRQVHVDLYRLEKRVTALEAELRGDT